MSYTKTLSNYACSKRVRVTLPSPIKCIVEGKQYMNQRRLLCYYLNNVLSAGMEIELLRNITRLHFYWSIRTAGLEQEVENLKKKLADCIKENSNIKDELSEAKRIKVRFFFCIPLRIFHCHLLVCA